MFSDTLSARPELSHGRVNQGLGGLLAPLLLIRKVEKWSEGQQQRFIVLQYITQSPEI